MYDEAIANYSKALEISLLGEMLGGEEAAQSGLVTRVVDAEGLDREVGKMAKALLAKARLAMAFV